MVAFSVAVIYDWVLSLGQEVDLIWNQRWSIITFLYLSVRYIGIPCSVISILLSLPTFPATDAVSIILCSVVDWMSLVVNAMLGVILITRLHAMCQESKMLIFLIVVFSAITIACTVITVILHKNIVGEAVIFSGNHHCKFDFQGHDQLLILKTWILGIVWETVTLCLAVWVTVKHFRRPSTGLITGDWFVVLMRAHILYFASFIVTSSLHLHHFFKVIKMSSTLGNQFYCCTVTYFGLMQLFVLGPRLILGVRELNAQRLNDFDERGTGPTIDFQTHVRISTSSDGQEGSECMTLATSP
ncbi:hypothetical protein BDR07DRAFT_11073 [Suillus spraguei]|nr:hypothetical protein BDR07DRAFT_11073 [Suillus spraguei]